MADPIINQKEGEDQMNCAYCGKEIICYDLIIIRNNKNYHVGCYRRLLRIRNQLLKQRTLFDIYIEGG